MFAAVSTFLNFVGFYALTCYLYEQLRTPYRLIKARWFTDEKERPSLKEKFGEWAAITGSSDGIGKEYAKELARQGINVVLIARNQEKLQAVVSEIESESKVQTKIVIADFTKGAEVYQHIEKELASLPIAILVNNVGIGNPAPIYKWTQESTQNIIETNIMAVSQLSRHFFQRMKAEKIKGAIVNVSSGTEHQPLPYGAYYAASKAYNRSFTLALQCEAAPYGIHVQLLSPDFVVTKINSYSRAIMKGGLFIPPADVYARSAVNQLRDGADETPGYLWHHVQTAVMLAVTWRIRRFFALKMFRSLK
ncbi:inactive hydroxysteroid dehydrogenase-like protein 1 [Drosophila guanche]|uniref:Blast:Inactive hydroxysteroid dehydrogenase-like protein 1 n=1 Tax=Drosophila guanche TaxID=7266 RepID=A0A3B0KF67_DROGU|nr:inactive hydroxysteroid dehydrogenase-like protein 1 [Drosophila guanche]SPP82258.1 blast:Inactive hydroxysteroid dehydrogenase-like protein 1 [Drosophila guanche]